MTTTLADRGSVAILRLVSLTVAAPSPERLAEVADLAAACAEVGGGPEELDRLASLAEATPPDEVAATHERLFGGAVKISPYEGGYEADPFRQARQMADVAGFYRAFGADAHGPAAERPDHAGCELEFLAYLRAKRVAAEEAGEADDAGRCREIEETFLREHAGRWLPAFFRAVAEADPGGVLGTGARVGGDWLDGELTRRGIDPAPAAPRSGRLPVEADELLCGDAVGPPAAMRPPPG